MSVMRIGGVLQPAWARTASAVTSSIQPAWERTAALSQRFAEKSQRAADLGIALLLAPAAFTALVLGLWRLGCDLGWTEQFFISDGLFSHWQVWLALSAALIYVARKLRIQ